jgi:hypothetical protein
MALDLYGRWIADDSDYNIAEAERAARVRKLTDAHLAQQRTESAPAASADPVEHTDNATAPRSGAAAPSSPREVERTRLVTPIDPVRALDAALNAAANDAERAALIAAVPRSVREQLAALSGYKVFMQDEPDPYDEFEHALCAAANDADRATLIAGRTPAFLVEWAWRTRATSDDWRRRYLALVDGNDAGQ